MGRSATASKAIGNRAWGHDHDMHMAKANRGTIESSHDLPKHRLRYQPTMQMSRREELRGFGVQCSGTFHTVLYQCSPVYCWEQLMVLRLISTESLLRTEKINAKQVGG